MLTQTNRIRPGKNLRYYEQRNETNRKSISKEKSIFTIACDRGKPITSISGFDIVYNHRKIELLTELNMLVEALIKHSLINPDQHFKSIEELTFSVHQVLEDLDTTDEDERVLKFLNNDLFPTAVYPVSECYHSGNMMALDFLPALRKKNKFFYKLFMKFIRCINEHIGLPFWDDWHFETVIDFIQDGFVMSYEVGDEERTIYEDQIKEFDKTKRLIKTIRKYNVSLNDHLIELANYKPRKKVYKDLKRFMQKGIYYCKQGFSIHKYVIDNPGAVSPAEYMSFLPSWTGFVVEQFFEHVDTRVWETEEGLDPLCSTQSILDFIEKKPVNNLPQKFFNYWKDPEQLIGELYEHLNMK